MMRKNASKKIREMGTFGIYLSSMLRHHRLKLTLDTGKMDICNIPTYCSTGESIWLNITPLQLHIFFWNIENICSTFANIFWNICKYFQAHLQTSWNIENPPPQMDFWLGDLRHVQLDWCACLNGESHFTDKLKIICLEIQNVFVIKLHNIFVKNTKYICSNHKIYLLKLRHIVQSLVSLISPKSRLLSLSCVMGRLCVTKKLFCPTVEFLANLPGGCAWH